MRGEAGRRNVAAGSRGNEEGYDHTEREKDDELWERRSKTEFEGLDSDESKAVDSGNPTRGTAIMPEGRREYI